MQKGIKNIIGIGLLATALKIGAVYTFSDKIGYLKHDVSKDLRDSLGKKEVLCDQETNDIINLMSGKISQKNFDELLMRHGYAHSTINIEKLIKPDEALYKTILEIQTKYTNPEISFSGFFDNLNIESGKTEPERPRYNIFNNTIHLHQLDARILQFKNMNQENKFRAERMMGIKSFAKETRQKYLLNNRVIEMSHGPQLKDQGVVKMGIDGLVDYISTRSKDNRIHGIKEEIIHQNIEEQELNKLKSVALLMQCSPSWSIVVQGIKKMLHYELLQEISSVEKGVGKTLGYFWMGFNYSDTYNKDGNLESEAHTKIQLEIIEDVIVTYKKYADLKNPDHVFMLAKLYRGFFTTYQNGLLVPYKDEKQSAFYLNMLENMGHEFSSYMTGRYYQEIYEKEYDYKLHGCDNVQDTLPVQINGDTITRAELFRKFIGYYEKSYIQGNIDAGFDILYMTNTHRRGEYDDLILRIGKNILKHHRDELENSTLSEIYKILGSVYYHKGNKKKGEKYYKLSRDVLFKKTP